MRLLVAAGLLLAAGTAPALADPVVCPAGPLTHFQCYDVARMPFDRLGVSLTDEFGASTVEVRRPKLLCTPVNKNDEDPTASADPHHLVGYEIHRDTRRFERVVNEVIEDQFGTLVLDLRRPVQLLVPSVQRRLTDPATPLAPSVVDHYQCYSVRGDRRRVANVKVEDQFGSEMIDVKKPLRLCVPVDKAGEGILDPAARLMCYQIKPGRRVNQTVFVDNQFGLGHLEIRRARALCLPVATPAPVITPTPTVPAIPTMTPLPSATPVPTPVQLDLVFANFGVPDTICTAIGGGDFTCSTVSAEATKSNDVAAGHLNGDSHLDLVIAISDGPNQVCLGDGAGAFSCQAFGASRFHQEVALGFVDGDPNLDAVFGTINRNRICLGDGAGGFSCSDVSLDENISFDVALGFVNADAYLDAVFANSNARNRICHGDGIGGFTCSDVSSDEDFSDGVVLGRVDGGTSLDVIFANQREIPPRMPPQVNRLCLGDGCRFGCSDLSSDSRRFRDVAAKDVNGDTRLDAVFAAISQQRNLLCLGDGAGAFACGDLSVDAHYSNEVTLADVDANGTVDAVFANGGFGSGQRNRLCRGDGAGTFVCEDVGTGETTSTGVAAGSFAE